MKKIILVIATIIIVLPMSAQEVAFWESYKLDSISQDGKKHVSLDGRCPVLVENIDRIVYEKVNDNTDVMAVYMKDGYVLRLDGFLADIQFNKELFVPIMPCTTETSHLNNYIVKWNVSDLWKKDGRYIVCISWYNLQGVDNLFGGICIGKTSGLTIENSEHVLNVEDYRPYVIVGDKLDDIANEYGSIPIRLPYGYYDYAKSDWVYSGDNYTYHNVDWDANHWLKTSLEYGKTYFYRPFIKVDVLQNGGKKPMVFYGVEKSFRVPYVMEDAGYNGNPIPTETAMKEFDSHFPDTVTAPTWEDLEPLWLKWQQTEEAKQIDMSAYYSPLIVFDNGTINSLTHIPDEFYTWLTHREIVIDPYDDIFELSKIRDPQSTNITDSVYTVWPKIVVPDTSWNIPGGKYVSFEEIYTTVNHSITYRSNEMIPGVRYKLQISFAPETEYEPKLGTVVRMLLIPKGRNIIELKKNYEISGTEVTTIELDDIYSKEMGLDYRIYTRVGSADIRNHILTRIIRIAEMKLIPIDN